MSVVQVATEYLLHMHILFNFNIVAPEIQREEDMFFGRKIVCKEDT